MTSRRWGRIRSALRAYVLEAPDPGTVLSMLDRNVQYFDPDVMATVLYGLYTPDTSALTFCSAGHLPRYSRPRAGTRHRCGPPGPPIGTADGLVERRDEPIDTGIGRVADTLQDLNASSLAQRNPALLAEDACAAVMRNLVGSKPTRDDIALLTLYRHSGPLAG